MSRRWYDGGSGSDGATTSTLPRERGDRRRERFRCQVLVRPDVVRAPGSPAHDGSHEPLGKVDCAAVVPYRRRIPRERDPPGGRCLPYELAHRSVRARGVEAVEIPRARHDRPDVASLRVPEAEALRQALCGVVEVVEMHRCDARRRVLGQRFVGERSAVDACAADEHECASGSQSLQHRLEADQLALDHIPWP